MGTDSRLAVIFVVSYLLGCFCSAYYLVRWRSGQDVRSLHSGTAGARNAGRVLGRGGFVLCLVLDVLKGVLAVLLARWLLADDRLAEVIALAGVLLGHVFPAQLGFRGGKGVAVLIGATLMIDPFVLLAVGVAAALIVMVLRRTNQSTIIAMAILPVAACWLCDSAATIAGFTMAAIMVLFFHRRNIHDIFAEYRKDR